MILTPPAAGGTLFLDEIGDLAPLRPKLLRVLQDGTFERVAARRNRLA